MSVTAAARRPARPGLLGALALATDAADELVLGAARDVHTAVVRRVHALGGAGAAGRDSAPSISSLVYRGVGAGLRTTSKGLRAADRAGIGARLEESPGGRLTVSAVNGLLGDRLVEDGSDLAIEMAVRVDGRDVPPERSALARAFPRATSDLVVFLHGLGENEQHWDRRAEETDGSYADRISEESSWTPVLLRANTGLPIAENGVALASLLDRLVDAWPTDVRRIALVGHSMGGLIIRAACAVDTRGAGGAADRGRAGAAERPWNALVTNIVTLGTPHLGAPLERGVALGAKVLGLLPESAPFGRILEYRSVGILDLRAGLAADMQNLPHARYHLVAATLAESWRHPVSELFGDLLVRYPSATGRPRRGREMFPGADVLHVRGGHFDLLNHDEVYRSLRTWLS